MKSDARDQNLFRRIALLWAGVIIGCTFVATPVKFRAPDISLKVALEVGQITFRSVGAIELILAVIGLVFLFRSRKDYWLAYVPVIILAIEWAAVMPSLDAQTSAEIKGLASPGGFMHVAFVALEVVKLGVLLVLGFSGKAAPN